MVDALAATFSPSLNEKNELEQEPVNMETLASQQSSRLVMSRELESGVDSPFDLESGVNSPMELESEMNTPMEPESGRDSPMERPTPPSSTIKEDIRKQRKEKKDLQDFKNKHPEFNKRKGASIHLNDENDELKGGSEVKLVPQAIEAIKFLRKVRDEEDDFARYKDMERIQPPPMPLNLSSSSSSSSNHFNTAPPSSLNTANITKVNGTNRPKTAKRGIKMMTNKERELLSEETRSQELIELQNQNPEYYIEKDLITGSTFCNVCGTPLLPDPKIEQLSIWLHAIRYCEFANHNFPIN